MALEESIVTWSKGRPAWQRAIMGRVAVANLLTDEEYDELVESIIDAKDVSTSDFGLEQLPPAASEYPPIRLLSIERLEHVNALESSDALTFEPLGLTIVYGDNASGKSGYARLLKRITRARHQEDILTDVFRDNSLAQPSAMLTVRIADDEESIDWPGLSHSELQRMLFYDGACGNAYIATESDFPYRPYALFVMDGLIEACGVIRSRLDAKLAANNTEVNDLPAVPESERDTVAGRFLASLSANATTDALDALISTFNESPETIEALKAQEARLRSADTSIERQRLIRQSEKCEVLRVHLERLQVLLGDEGLVVLEQHRKKLTSLAEATEALTRSFGSEPLSGVGSSPWKELWESARRYSEVEAYQCRAFPVLDEDCRCVLCQQILNEETRERLERFERFVKDDTQVKLHETRRVHDHQVVNLTGLVVLPDIVVNDLKDLEATHRDLVAEIRELLGKCEAARDLVSEALRCAVEIPQTGIASASLISRLKGASEMAKATAEALASPEGVKSQLATIVARRGNLELLQQIKNARQTIVKEILRLTQRSILEAAKAAAATGPITKKILELSEESITEVVRDAFTRETDRLRLERVTIARTSAEKGALFHQPKLVGARQKVTLPKVFSEGERTALGLAAFFTEVQLDTSHSAIILDDPVTSLDHTRRGLVAARLAALAENRQVVVFTHDVAFVADLKREATGKCVPVAERTVVRSRMDERKPGTCTMMHPWKAKDVSARFHELRSNVARMKMESRGWDEKAYEDAVAVWAGNLSETWERIFSQEIVGPLLAEGGLEVRPMMVKVLARFSDSDHREFEASYSRVSQWAKRHDKSAVVNYVAPDITDLEAELNLAENWFKRIKGYKN